MTTLKFLRLYGDKTNTTIIVSASGPFGLTCGQLAIITGKSSLAISNNNSITYSLPLTDANTTVFSLLRGASYTVTSSNCRHADKSSILFPTALRDACKNNPIGTTSLSYYTMHLGNNTDGLYFYIHKYGQVGSKKPIWTVNTDMQNATSTYKNY
jgi:hypothetical protein